MTRILLVEDDASLRSILSYHLEQAGYKVTEAADGRQALDQSKKHDWDLVVTDIRMPRIDGVTLLKEIRRSDVDLPIILITAHGTIEDAVAAIKAGAFDYITKPVEREVLLRVVGRALKLGDLQRENRLLRENLEQRNPLAAMLGNSAVIQEAISLIRRAGPTEATVLLTGESGTGKELAARAIHALSARSGKEFVAINCAALPADLLESELFGHRKGAFTGATADHPGKFRQAHGGTLFLDEIAEMDLRLQAKLLRVLQEKVVDPVGSTRSILVDVRLVAATNQTLAARIREGRFREDLYHRLNVITIDLPPLRERGDDILLFLNHFYRQFGGGSLTMTREAVQVLVNYRWPGNIRELMNLCQKLAILYPNQQVTLAMLPHEYLATSDTLPESPPAGLWEIECDAIRRALNAQRGNKSAAARALGIPRHVLLYRMKKFGIPD